MNVVVFGATGMVGARIAAELEQRGHAVTAATRATGADVTDPQSVASVAAGADAVVSAVSARGVSYTLADVAPALVEGVREAGVRRLVIVGGAGSLEVAPGTRLMDNPSFPEQWKPEAIDQSEALDRYRGVEDLGWTFASPGLHPSRRAHRPLPARPRTAAGRRQRQQRGQRRGLRDRDRRPARTGRPRTRTDHRRLVTHPTRPIQTLAEGGPKWQSY
jgi:putative NADH-flavin reductase